MPGSVIIILIYPNKLKRFSPQHATRRLPHIKLIFLATFKMLNPQIKSSAGLWESGGAAKFY